MGKRVRLTTNPRKAPRQARAAATVSAILEATAHILREGGLPGLSTNRIAERAGASIGSLYQYFPSREAILAELLRRERAVLLEHFKSVTARMEELPLAAAIDALISAGVAHQIGDARLSLALEYVESLLPVEHETAKSRAELERECAVLLAYHRVNEPECTARDLLALTRGLIDDAGRRGETDGVALAVRVRRAAMGYLGQTQSTARPPQRNRKPPASGSSASKKKS